MGHKPEDIDIYDLGPFKSVTYDYWLDPTTLDGGGFPHRATLHFESEAVLSVRVNPDTDEVAVHVGSEQPSLGDGSHKTVEVRTFPWTQVEGLRVDWMWRMTNQNGFFDGLQLQFASSGGRVHGMAIQFIAIASRLDVGFIVPLAPATRLRQRP
jgi:hypothetical protein